MWFQAVLSVVRETTGTSIRTGSNAFIDKVDHAVAEHTPILRDRAQKKKRATGRQRQTICEGCRADLNDAKSRPIYEWAMCVAVPLFCRRPSPSSHVVCGTHPQCFRSIPASTEFDSPMNTRQVRVCVCCLTRLSWLSAACGGGYSLILDKKKHTHTKIEKDIQSISRGGRTVIARTRV